jgi:putative inorganic carbon (HCO3(-)) transporter
VRRRRTLGGTWRAAFARLLWCEPLWIAFLAPALLFPGRFWVAEWQPALVLLLFLFWPLRLLLTHSLGAPRLLVLPSAALLGAVALSLLRSPAPAASWEAAGYLLLGVAAALALVNWPPVRRQPSWVAWLLLGLGGALASLGPLLLGAAPQKFRLGSLIPASGGLGGALGETVNPNVLGGALVIPALLSLALAVGPRWSRRPWRLVCGIFGLSLLLVLLLTQCRGAYLGAATGVLLLLLLRWPRLGWVALPAVLVVALLGASGTGLSLVFDAMGGGTGTGAAQDGVSGRLQIWQFALHLFAQRPWQGAGLGLFAAMQTPVAGSTPAPHAHDLLLQVGMDLGLPGLLAYLALLGGVIAMLWNLLRRRESYERLSTRERQQRPGDWPQRIAATSVYRTRLHWTLALGAAAALSGMLVHGLVDAALWGNKVAFLPWLLFALVASLYQTTKEAL